MENSTGGITPGVPMAEYLRLPGASASRLRLLRQSPAHCRYAMDNPREETPAMAFGRAVHTAILEPDEFGARYAVSEPCSVELASGKRKGEPCGNPGKRPVAGGGWVCGTHDRDEAPAAEARAILSPEDHATALALRDAAWTHPAAKALLSAPGVIESTVRWEEDGEGGDLPCIGRPDKVTESGLIVDLKTTRDASPHGTFPRDLYTYGYVMQAVHYWAGLVRLGREIRSALIIAVESEAPHGVAVYQPDLQARVAATEERDALLRVWERCVRTGEWPAYPTTIQPIGLPAWAHRQIEERAVA